MKKNIRIMRRKTTTKTMMKRWQMTKVKNAKTRENIWTEAE